MVWPPGALTARPEYWNFRLYCETVYQNLYGYATSHGSVKSFSDLLEDQLYTWGGRFREHHASIDFTSERHQTMWLLRWSSP